MLTLTVVRAEPVELERELLDLEQLRWRVVESLSSRLQGPRQRHILRVKLSELNRSIASIRQTLSRATTKIGTPAEPGGDRASAALRRATS
jgi:hypothetical protein